MEMTNGKKNIFFSSGHDVENKYYNPNYIYDENNSSLFMLSKKIPQNSIIIDLACGSGKLGYVINNEKIQCELYGVEMDPVAAKCAAESGYYKDIFIFNITDHKSAEYLRMVSDVVSPDVIVMSDILEHLADPTTVLLHYLKMLNDKGFLLISVPNVAHVDIGLGLLDGKFNYTQEGILDNTHLKFFTYSSFFQWIDLINQQYSMNLNCEFLGATYLDSEYLEFIKKEYMELFELLTLYPYFNSLQILFMITKNKNNNSIIQQNDDSVILDESVVKMLCTRLKGMDICVKKNKNAKLFDHERLQYEKRLYSLNKHLESLQDYAIHLENNCNASKEIITQNNGRITALLDYQAHLEDTIRQYDERVTALLDYQVKLEDTIKQRDERVTALLNYQVKLEDTIRQRDERITALLDYQDRLEETIGQRDERVEELLDYKVELEDTVKKLDGHVTELLDYQAHLEDAVRKRDEHVTELLGYQTHLEDTVKRLEQKQEQIQQTIAWKLFLERKFAKQDH
jgi:2-polyprenyl-3-methyl-5-hydroxy-6-metoxy-1,4-benzoquinol methylase